MDNINCIHLVVRATRDPIRTKSKDSDSESTAINVAYKKTSGRYNYITLVGNGAMGEKMMCLKKGDVFWIEGNLHGYETDKWKSYINVKGIVRS